MPIPGSTDPWHMVENLGGAEVGFTPEELVLGLPAKDKTPSVDLASLVYNSRRKVYGSQIGGIKETQEMLDYSVANNLYPHVEVIPVTKIDEAYENVVAGKVKFRYVIDMKTLA